MRMLNQLAPDFSLLDQQARTLTLDQVMGERGLVLLFFSSSWLPADLALLKAFNQAYPTLQAAGLGVMGISGINWETIHHLSDRLDCQFPLGFDSCCRVSKRYDTMLIPKFVTGKAIYGINPQGRIIFDRKQAQPDEVLAAFKPAE